MTVKISRINKKKIWGLKDQIEDLKILCKRRGYASNVFYERVIEEAFYKIIQPKFHIQDISNLKQKHSDYVVLVWKEKYKNIKTLKNRLAAWKNILIKMDKHALVKENDKYGIEKVIAKYQDKRLNNNEYQKDYLDIKKVDKKEVRHTLYLQRLFGLRMREASLMKAEESIVRNENGKIIRLDIIRGSKSGRPRWIPVVTNSQRKFLEIIEREYKGKNTIPKGVSFKQWSDKFYYQCKKYGITDDEKKPHGLRQSYAQERFDRLMKMIIDRNMKKEQKVKIDKIKKQAGIIVSRELGHNRLRVLVHYIENWNNNNLLKIKYIDDFDIN